MNKRKLMKLFAIASAAIPSLLLSNSILSADLGSAGDKTLKATSGTMGPAPKAECGRWDWTESGLQGQTSNWERESGDSEGGYNCNLELVGQFKGEGAFSQDGPAYYKNCAYMSTENDPLQQHPGVVVIDVSDPTNPVATTYLDDTPAGLNPHELVSVSQGRGLLGLAQSNGANFAVYDLNADCTHPKLASSITVPGSVGHMGGFSKDGKTYFIGQSFRGFGGTTAVINVDDPYNAKHYVTWTFNGDGRMHDATTNQAGTRLYVVQPGTFGAVPPANMSGPEGLVILDISDVQARKPDPQYKIIGSYFWGDEGGGGGGEQPNLVTYNGHPYIITTSESGPQGGTGGLAAACARGRGAYGYSHVIDIADETKPKEVSRIMLEIHDPANCEAMMLQPPEVGGGILDLSTERCAPERFDNPTLLACGSRGTGTRVYDISDVLHPKEIAYWKGPAPRTAFLPGSGSWSPGIDRTVEKQAGLARWVKVPAANGKSKEWNLWVVGDAGGFQVLRFTQDFLDRAKSLPMQKALLED